MKKNKVDSAKLNEFLAEAEVETKEKVKTRTALNVTSESNRPNPTYSCPKCQTKLTNRSEPCPSCGYKGYVPLSDLETKKIRMILFVVLSVLVIVIYFLNR